MAARIAVSHPHFRAIKSAVSLKRGTWSWLGLRSALFPRHQKRGLIEAVQSATRERLVDSFPRHQKRGLIEALGWVMARLR